MDSLAGSQPFAREFDLEMGLLTRPIEHVITGQFDANCRVVEQNAAHARGELRSPIAIDGNIKLMRPNERDCLRPRRAI
jgi:hypothetical protein